jgi:hypothetical protein
MGKKIEVEVSRVRADKIYPVENYIPKLEARYSYPEGRDTSPDPVN